MTSNYSNRKGNKKLVDIFCYIILILGGGIMILPFLWMISTSLKMSGTTFVFPPQLIPKPVTFENYMKVFQAMPMARVLGNSIFISIVSTAGQLLLCSMAAYAFARIQFKGRDIIFLLYLATLMMPNQVTYTPLFILMQRLDWGNTYKALILPGMFSAFGTFFMRQYFLTIPTSLEEAAFIDGAGYLRVFFKIILPLSKPALATLTVFTFMESWNSYLWPLIITSDTAHMTLPLALASMSGRWHTDWNALMAGTVVTVLPMLMVYLFAQKYIIKGITLTGIKG